jgi:hypothetical protein
MAKWSDLVSVQEQSRVENWADPLEQSNATVVLECAWADRHQFVKELKSDALGRPYIDNSTAPIRLFAKDVQVDWLSPQIKYTTDADNQISNPTTARVTVTFKAASSDGGGASTRTRHPETGDEIIVTESIEPASRYFTVNHRRFSLHPTKVELPDAEQAPAIVRREFRFIRSIRGLSTLIDTSYLNLIGSVNEDKITSSLLPGLVFEAETLLFDPEPVISETFIDSSSGTRERKLNITIAADYNPNGWNRFATKNFRLDPRTGDIKLEFQEFFYIGPADEGGFPRFKPYPPEKWSSFFF